MSEIVFEPDDGVDIVFVAETPLDNFEEIDGRWSGETYYRLVHHIGSLGLALMAISSESTRAIYVDGADAADALAHPEVYLSHPDTIFR